MKQVFSLLNAAVFAVLPLAGMAQIAPDRQNDLTMVYDGDFFARCMVERDDPATCIGYFRTSCGDIAETEEEWLFCIQTEARSWDEVLTRDYQKVLAKLTEQDFAAGTPEGHTAQSRAGALRQMQQSWTAYRDARCSLEGLGFGSGSAALEQRQICLSDLTAQQALYMRSYIP